MNMSDVHAQWIVIETFELDNTAESATIQICKKGNALERANEIK